MRRSTKRHVGARSKQDSIVATLRREDPSVPFGPAFFLTRLGAFVRDRCPTPADGLPIVMLHLADGEVLDVCHVIGLARSWVALAVHDERGLPGPPRMRTVVVPYCAVTRVTFRADTADGVRVGFRQAREPVAFSADSKQASQAALPGCGSSGAAHATAMGSSLAASSGRGEDVHPAGNP